MDEIILKKIKNVSIKNPIFIEGLPGIGFVGKLAADYLIKSNKMEKIIDIYSSSLPPEVDMKESGVIEPVRYELYHKRKNNVNYIILTGDAQPSDPRGQYILNKFLIDHISKYKPKMILTLGGYATGKIKKNDVVYGAATNDKLVQKYKDIIIFGKSPGHIYGAAGQLLSFGMLRNIEGICLMGATHGSYVDAHAAKAVLKALDKILNINIDLKDFNKQIKMTDKFIKELENELKKMSGGITPRKLQKGSYL